MREKAYNALKHYLLLECSGYPLCNIIINSVQLLSHNNNNKKDEYVFSYYRQTDKIIIDL